MNRKHNSGFTRPMALAFVCGGMYLYIGVIGACTGGGGSDKFHAVATIGAEGGSIRSNGLTLTIPPGALDDDHEISITTRLEPIPEGLAGLSPLYSIEPSGLKLHKDATIRIDVANFVPGAALHTSEQSSGEYVPVLSEIESGSISADTSHFSYWVAASHPSALYEGNPNPECQGSLEAYAPLKGSFCTIPVLVLVEKDAAGNPYLTDAQVDDELAFVNTMFSPAGFTFKMIEKKWIDHIGAKQWDSSHKQLRCDELPGVKENLQSEYVTLAFTQDWQGIPGRLPVACVYPHATYALDQDVTTPHELGHVLGLLHPHQFGYPGEVREPASNPPPNCYDVQLGGDGFCDTPPDPNISRNDRCVVADDCGVECSGPYADYSPNPHLLMSYAPDECRSDPQAAWSSEQINFMNCYFFHKYNPRLCGSAKPCSKTTPQGPCPPDMKCSGGACVPQTPTGCTDLCAPNSSKCNVDTMQVCGQYDADPCLEWGGDITCPSGCDGVTCKGDSCPNGICDPGELCSTCPQDCPCMNGLVCQAGACVATCPDGICDPALGEGCSSCPQDCACSGGLVCKSNACMPCVPTCSGLPAYPVWTDSTNYYTVRARMSVSGCNGTIEMTKGDGGLFSMAGTMRIFDENLNPVMSQPYATNASSVTISMDIHSHLGGQPSRYIWVAAESVGGSCPNGPGCYFATRSAGVDGCGGSICLIDGGCM